ncbi:hypothetical protein JCM11491_000492 [Sporobolomyces phaffii]
MAELQPPPAPSRSPSTSPSPSPPPRPATKRQPSFWERTKQSTAGVWDNAYKLGSRSKQQSFESCYPSSLEIEAIRAARILRTLTYDAVDVPEDSLADRRKSQIPLLKIPPETIQAARGLAILTVFRTGSLFGAVSGSGIVLSRLPDGSWSAPSALLLKTIGFGFLAGVDIYDIVLLLRNDFAVEAFSQSQVSLGEDTSVAAGPVGNGMLLNDAAELAAVWSYAKSNNLYEPVNLEGTVFLERNEENARTYNRSISAEEILNGAIQLPPWCEGLRETIAAAEGLDYRPELIPQGPSASESFPSPPLDHATNQNPFSPPISPPVSPDPSIMSNASRTSNRRLPKEELSEEDLAAKRELEEAMRSFGIEDPTVNERSRSEDPLLVVEERADESFEFENATPGLTRASSVSPPGSRRTSAELNGESHGQASEEGPSHGSDDVAGGREDKSKSGPPSITNSPSTPSKPPVPPRRTPRIPAPASPVVGQESPTTPATEETRTDPEAEGAVPKAVDESDNAEVARFDGEGGEAEREPQE